MRHLLGCLAIVLLVQPTCALADAPEASSSGLEVSGWAEVLVQRPDARRQDGRRALERPSADMLRAAIEFERRFDAHFSTTLELEIEHAGIVEDEIGIAVDSATSRGEADLGGEVRVEEAYVDWKWSERLGVRAGIVLVPLGLVNLEHEPADYLGARRPDVERRILPATWSALGAGFTGADTASGFAWQAYLLEGLDATRFSAGEAVREGRRKGSRAPAAHPAVAARLDWARGAGALGTALFTGDSWQDARPAGGSLHARVTLGEVHAALSWRGMSARALCVGGRLSDHEALSRELGVAGTDEALGGRFWGSWQEASWDVLPLLARGAGHSLVVFARHEESDTQDGVGGAGTEAAANHQRSWTLGMSFRPHEDLVLKLDRQLLRDGARTGVDQWNAGLGFEF